MPAPCWPGSPCGRVRTAGPSLAALLWPDVLDASARASLRSALWALRAAFGPTAGEYLRAGRDFAELAGDGLRVDVREFGRLLAAGCPAEAVALHRGDLLSQFDADWVLDARDEHEDRLCAAYAALAAAAEADGDTAAARDWAARRAAARPLDEHAARELIRLLMADGDQAGAVAAYQRLAARLSAELGISPAAETTRLVAAALRVPPAAVPAPEQAPEPAPAPGWPADRLVGRDSELRALLRHWRAARRGSGTAARDQRGRRHGQDPARAGGAHGRGGRRRQDRDRDGGRPGCGRAVRALVRAARRPARADRPAARSPAARGRRLADDARGHPYRQPGAGDRAGPGPDPLLRGDRGTAHLGGTRPAARPGPRGPARRRPVEP